LQAAAARGLPKPDLFYPVPLPSARKGELSFLVPKGNVDLARGKIGVLFKKGSGGAVTTMDANGLSILKGTLVDQNAVFCVDKVVPFSFSSGEKEASFELPVRPVEFD
jgi:hypothetical protein